MIFDVNIALGRWPFRFPLFSNASELVSHLQDYGITGGIVRSMEAPFCRDIYEVNSQLCEELEGYPNFRPACAVHPAYKDRGALSGAAAVLYPSFHGYSLVAPEVLEMAVELARRHIVIMVVMREEDERNQNPMCLVKPPSIKEVDEFACALPGTDIIVLNAYSSEIKSSKAVNLYFDIAFAEEFPALEPLLKVFPVQRLLFGSMTPLFYTSAALSKLDSRILNDNERSLILSGNAGGIFSWKN